jgi:hypothetical protein
MADLGVDLQAEVARYRQVGAEAYFASDKFAQLRTRAAFIASQRTQFGPPTVMTKPTFWNHPIGRVMFQFKTYALGQSKLLRDSVFAEFAAGNARPLAYFMAMAPLSGAFIKEVKDQFRGKPREMSNSPVLAAAQYAMYAGGFGLATDIWSTFERGDGASLFGPTVDSLYGLGNALVTMDSDKLLREGTSVPLVRVSSKLFEWGAEVTDDLVKDYLAGTGSDNAGRITIDLGAATAAKLAERHRERLQGNP